ncbi:hypothetical protein D3C81_1999350 [compost metagenome]
MFADSQSQDSSVSSDSLSAMGKSIPIEKYDAQHLAIAAMTHGHTRKMGSIVQVNAIWSPKFHLVLSLPIK